MEHYVRVEVVRQKIKKEKQTQRKVNPRPTHTPTQLINNNKIELKISFGFFLGLKFKHCILCYYSHSDRTNN